MTEKTYPERFYIVVGEDIRNEGDGQFSLMGINPSGLNSVVFNNENMLPSIAVYCVLYEPTGTFEGKISITDEEDNVIVEAIVPVESNLDDKTMKLLLAGKFMNVVFKKPGKFKVTISLDDRTYSESFKISEPK